MVSIFRSNSSPNLGNAQINPGAGVQSGAASLGQAVASSGPAFANSAQAINNSIAQFGAAVEAEGAKLFAESKRAHQSALLLDKTSKATEAFMSARVARSQRTIDENGNPTFESLVRDVGAIGDKLIEDTVKTIVDPEVAQQFRLQFGNFVANQKVGALKEAAAQQVDFARANLNKGLYSLTNQAIGDTYDQVGTYEAMGKSALDDALAAGAISAVEHEKMSRGFSNQIRVESIKNTIGKDRNAAAMILGRTSEELGIEPAQHARLLKQVDAAIRADHIAARKAQEVMSLDEKVSQAQIVEQLGARIQAGALREDELIGFQDKLNPQQFNSLKKMYVRESIKQAGERAGFKDLADRINNGDDVTDVKPAQLNKFYNFMLGQQSDVSGKKPTLADEASLAASIPAPVKPFAEKLEYAALHAEPGRAAEALEAYSYIKDRKASTLDSGFDRKATAVMEHAQLLVEKGGMDPAAALERAREKVMTAKDEDVKSRKAEFRKVKDFNDKNIEETAATALDAESWIGRNNISPEAVKTFKQFAQEGYEITGDKDAAVAFAKENLSRTYGTSIVTGKGKMVYMPPEKVYPNTSPELMRKILIDEVKGGIDPNLMDEDISIEADPLTFRRDNPTWIVTHKRDIGGAKVEMPLVNPKTGELVRWSPKGSKVPEQMLQQEVEAAKAARGEFVAKQQRIESTGDNMDLTGP